MNLELSQPTCHGFTASWNNVPGATDYSIYLTHSGSLASYRSTSNTFLFNSTGKSINYSVYIKANCGTGSQSVSSNVETMSTLTIGCKDEETANTQSSTTYTNGMIVNPNPNNGQYIIDATFSNTTDNGKLQVMNLLGQVMSEKTVNNNNGLVHTAVDNANLAAGVYLVRVQIGSETHLARIVIMH